ncbi:MULTISPECIES: alpha/beta hydrolase [unclassified Pseudomonas]|uniref:alpha/beta hydrolase n=1 Tax=unclassified Pseudomonas TaxID=196821 RepID=UPI000C888074|nr:MULTISPECIES: alpha/beta hydrolase [unclassified Pseudomonas]PMZ97625.1 alpha/beta hydrolase [Pseudomonas sp. FW305-BF15]PNB77363.1 alpha/beta hydrolase [Pseudomonas sp. FW305-BF6]
MSAETVTCEKGNNYKLHKEHTLTDKKDVSVKAVPVESTKAIIFFIGGAGDKESYYFSGPFENVNQAKSGFDDRNGKLEKEGKYKSEWLGYNEVRGKKDIQKYVLNLIPYKSCPIYIVGHSLGGWNGAHLTRVMSEWGYRINMLVTLDPVGEGTLVWLGSDIYGEKPTPVADYWINMKATPSRPDQSDSVADFGEKWQVVSGPNVNVNMDTNHANAPAMFTRPIAQGKSASDLMFEAINKDVC